MKCMNAGTKLDERSREQHIIPLVQRILEAASPLRLVSQVRLTDYDLVCYCK